MQREGADVIVVGGGHNGLICAAYLARAGIDTLLVEARADVGGCASTVSDLGARFNICNCDHTMIRAMPIIDELELAAHGLTYLEAEASYVHLFHDGAPPWPFFHDTDRMLDTLRKAYPGQADAYRRYLDDALPVAELVLEMSRTKPGAPRMIARALARRAHGMSRLLDWSRRSVQDVFAEYFDDWHLTMPAISTGPTVWGVAPETPGTGLAAAAYALRHLVRTGRPVGGSGALTDATRASLEASGGRVLCGARVERLLVADGAIAGVRLDDQTELRAPAVVAACDPHRLFVDWLDEVPRAAHRLVERWRNRPVHDGYESKLDALIDRPPRFRATGELEQLAPGVDFDEPTMIVSQSPRELREAHELRAAGHVAEHPTILVNTPSVLDPTMRTADGSHVLSVEVLYTPYALVGGWEGSGEPERWFEVLSDLLEPGELDGMSDWRAMTPDRYESEFSMHRGHTPSYSGGPLAALIGRPRELTRYRAPISGLYLSGAATFPGAGVFGAAGRNAAAVVHSDLRGRVGSKLAPLRRTTRSIVNAAWPS